MFGSQPPPLLLHGFTSTGDNLFVFGGMNEAGKSNTSKNDLAYAYRADLFFNFQVVSFY